MRRLRPTVVATRGSPKRRQQDEQRAQAYCPAANWTEGQGGAEAKNFAIRSAVRASPRICCRNASAGPWRNKRRGGGSPARQELHRAYAPALARKTAGRASRQDQAQEARHARAGAPQGKKAPPADRATAAIPLRDTAGFCRPRCTAASG